MPNPLNPLIAASSSAIRMARYALMAICLIVFLYLSFAYSLGFAGLILLAVFFGRMQGWLTAVYGFYKGTLVLGIDDEV